MFIMTTQNSTIVCDYLEPQNEQQLFAKQLVTNISRGQNRVSLTLSDKSIVAFARELGRFILAEKATLSSGEGSDDGTLLTKQEVIKKIGVSSTTLWLWEKKDYLVPVKIGRKVFYRIADINKLCENKH